MRLVLDSNVWLDWLFFDDPGVAPLKHAKQNGTVEIVIDAPCRDELVRVLGYDRFGLDTLAQAAMLGNVNRLSTLLEDLCYAPEHALPFCSDPDDVKFLALAAACKADWLITKDNALLSKRRKRKAFPVSYRVASPQQWALYQSDTPVLPA